MKVALQSNWNNEESKEEYESFADIYMRGIKHVDLLLYDPQ